MFTWSKLEIWIAGLLAALIVVGGAGHLLLDWRGASRVVVVEARSGSADEDTASVAAPPVKTVSVPEVDGEGAEVSEEDARDDGRSAGGAAGGSPGPDEGGDGEEQIEDSAGADGARSPADGTEEEAVASGVDERININTAPASELQRLPGIGPALSARIVAYRETWGPFSAIEDIMEVSGIGPVKFAAIRDLIKVR